VEQRVTDPLTLLLVFVLHLSSPVRLVPERIEMPEREQGELTSFALAAVLV
jgi:hypothetical protein